MDITIFFVSHRNDALLVGDYGTYRKRLSRRLLTVRRRLGRSVPKGRKYTDKAAITAEDISGNTEFIQLFLLTAERAWAHAMYMKSMHSADSAAKGMTGSTRKHIVSRLRRAYQTAETLFGLLKSPETSGINSRVVLEAGAYSSLLLGALDFESLKWEKCLRAYSEARLIYSALDKISDLRQDGEYRDLLSSIIDPSIRYAAYQIRLPRTLSIDSIMERFLPMDSENVQKVKEMELKPEDTDMKIESEIEASDIPQTIQWRSRTVNIEDARIGQSLASASFAGKKLGSIMTSNDTLSNKDKAAAYDEILNSSQDAVDATKTAIDELVADGISQADRRMQALQISRTAVNYALVSWRVGRNRVLCGRDDGAFLEDENKMKVHKPKNGGREYGSQPEPLGKTFVRLRERVVLYDGIIQSLDSINDLPGVAADQALLGELSSTRSYFSSLRCLVIARSHSLIGNTRNALALFQKASAYCQEVSSTLGPPMQFSVGVLGLELSPDQIASLRHLLLGLVSQHRALVEVHNLGSEQMALQNTKEANHAPLLERLDEYPVGGADLRKLVVYPPQIQPVPVKPLFLDVAWNYIDYPNRARKTVVAGDKGANPNDTDRREEKKEGRKGWFGFGL